MESKKIRRKFFVAAIDTIGYERTIRIERSLEQSRQLQYVYRTLIGIAEQGRYTEANSANAVEAAVSGIAIIKKVCGLLRYSFSHGSNTYCP